ncbi:hypothetical protein BDV98DRAFT_606935 [Pterulicium gracile]|uniref:TPR-like protein n=1 Tax=Pterulicium gracile TaxID=1884261 RepID=A0A5C3Q8I8_9AGAR|nr:hypothetical protein BDV98DRAFT_606935 [Pterula gracilis]
MAHPKDQHYWAQLRSTLTTGQWSSLSPAKTPHASPLSWSELLRKFNKHCRGFSDISQVVTHTRTLALLLRANSKDDDQDDVSAEEEWPLSLGSTCKLAEERKEEARVAYDALIKLNCNHHDTRNMALAYYAYALGDPSGCIAHLEKIPNLLSVQSHIPSAASVPQADTLHPPPSTSGTTTDGSSASWTGSFLSDGTAAQIVSADVKDGTAWALTETLRSICLQGMAYENIHPTSPDRAIQAYNVALPLITNLLNDFIPQTTRTSPASSVPSSTSFLAFTQHRELWRWVEAIIWRSACLLSRVSPVHDEDDLGMLWSWVKQYTLCTTIWPPDFRTQHRSTISVLYLRALVLRAQGRGPSSPTFNDAQQRHPYRDGHLEESQEWMLSARSLVNSYRAILSVSTKFPVAGQTNVKVEDFVDLCVAVWEAGGSAPDQAAWVTDILWWATRLTFNSPRILRHMSRLFYASGDITLAKRTLQVYVQVVSKGLLANHSGANKETDSDVNWILTTTNGARMLARIASGHASGQGWFDSANGSSARPTITKEGEHIDDAREAVLLVEKARARLVIAEKTIGADSTMMKELTKRVDLAEGVVLAVLGLAEQEPLTREQTFSKAHDMLVKATASDNNDEQTSSTSEGSQSLQQRQISLSLSSSAHFHLSLSFARPGPTQDMAQAIIHAGRALVGDQQNIRYWHLLGLLLAATESWEEAREALEQGAKIGEDDQYLVGGQRDSSGLPTPEDTAPPSTLTVGVNGANGSGTTRTIPEGLPRSHAQTDGHQPMTILPPLHHSPSRALTTSSATTAASRRSSLVPSHTLLGPLPDHPPPTKQENLEHALQLRMTQMALSEYTDGAEAAEALGVQVFLWAGRKRGTNTTSAPGSVRHDQPRSSIGSRPFTDISAQGNDVPSASRSMEHLPAADAPSLALPQSEPPHQALRPGHEDANENVPEKISHISPPNIKITPTTPVQEVFQQPLGLASLHEEKQRDRASLNGASAAVSEKDGADPSHSPVNSQSHDLSRSKKVQQLLKSQVHKGHETIRKIGSGVARTGGSLRRSNSTPDFHALLKTTHYQASSIHSRRRIGALIRRSGHGGSDSPPPPSPRGLQPSALPNTNGSGVNGGGKGRSPRENRAVSDLWLMCAATFRRSGKIEQAKGAIQEAEVIDEDNPAVWVQLGIYYSALGRHLQAAETFQKALFLAPDDVSASVHLCRLYLTEPSASRNHSAHRNHHCQQGRKGSTEAAGQVDKELVDLASGLLSHLTKGPGWDVPEAWYYLAKAYGMQGRKEKQKVCLKRALELSQYRGVREVAAAVGWCL